MPQSKLQYVRYGELSDMALWPHSSNEMWVKIRSDKGVGPSKLQSKSATSRIPPRARIAMNLPFTRLPIQPSFNVAFGPYKAQISSLCGKAVWRSGYSYFTHNVVYNFQYANTLQETRLEGCYVATMY